MKGKTIKVGQVRIIGGEWRSRKVSFLEAEGLRPTPDRVRETLFNWLAPYIEGAHCLDLFTGSGALSFEALSRGANSATLLDTNHHVIAHLKKQLALLNCPTANVINKSAMQFLQQPAIQQFDVVFLDPPFRQSLLQDSCLLLEQNNWLANEAWVYTESEITPSTLTMPMNWQLYKEKKAGQVYYALWHRV